ncbi:FadR/GntR family transcriptional regulator [Tropicimonas sp. IMCC6043]|uniref:FadR/GntR family transcriptional regulator n=1 Tax=Tropicimonas sp. IMCC6043 TaxID=2510645 RepID=UPI00101E217B|nr:FCD domain-containing protein [Tropicimonas sp. IMCC6043]RYH08736.1 FadR family transcriptional regulator [Tropicimonas sp. IMCC6043]
MGRTVSVDKDQPLGDQIAEALGNELLSGIFRPGDVLPTEVELAERFGVSRASVRSGLQALASRGIVERFVGQGTVAQDFSDWNILDPVVTGMLADHESPHPDLVRSIFEFRFSAEPLIAAVAARNARARDLVAMEDAIDGMARCAEARAPGTESFTQWDVSFHVAVYRATHNAVWSHLAHILRPAITLVVSRSNDSSEELREALERHRELMECIRLRDPTRAFESALRVMQLTAEELGVDPEFGEFRTAGADHPLSGLIGSSG